MSYDYLKSRTRDLARENLDRGEKFEGAIAGSFTSVQSANRLVNSTISASQDRVDEVARGEQSSVTISKRFTAATGYEAYLSRPYAEPTIRDTFGVKVLILRDPGSARGWRVHTAYPIR